MTKTNEIQIRHVGRKYGVSWPLSAHQQVLGVFHALRIRPSQMEMVEMVTGGWKWSALITLKAGYKLIPALQAMEKAS